MNISEIQITATISVGLGGIEYRGALIQGDYYRVCPTRQGKLSISAVKDGVGVFQASVSVGSIREARRLAAAARMISNVYNPEVDHAH